MQWLPRKSGARVLERWRPAGEWIAIIRQQAAARRSQASPLKPELQTLAATAGVLISGHAHARRHQNALKAVKYPGYSRDIVSFGLVKEISAANGAVSVAMQLTSPNPEAARQIKEESERVLKALPGVKRVHVEVRQPAAGQAAPDESVGKSKPRARREAHHRRRQRQGRRGQIHGVREPRLRAAASRRERRPAGLRHLRAEHSADDGRSRATDDQRRRAAGAAVQSRRESDEHRVAARRTTSR